MLWDRLHDESSLWYDRFETYRLLGPGRTIEHAFRISTGAKRPQRAGQAWHKAAERWNWKSRAEAWDASNWRGLAEEEALRRRAARERRLQIIEEALEDTVVALRKAQLARITQPEALLNISALRMMMRDCLQLQREELGDIEETNSDDGPQLDDKLADMITEIYSQEENDDPES